MQQQIQRKIAVLFGAVERWIASCLLLLSRVQLRCKNVKYRLCGRFILFALRSLPPGSAAPAGELKRMKSGLHPEGRGQPGERPGAGVSAITSPDLCIGCFLTDG